jgi:hypothetical protein
MTGSEGMIKATIVLDDLINPESLQLSQRGPTARQEPFG